MLEEWAAPRIYGSTLPKQGQIKPDTVLSYLSALKSYHIDRRLSLKGFDDPRMALIIKGGRRLFPSKKRNRLPITKNILEKITEDEPLSFFFYVLFNVYIQPFGYDRPTLFLDPVPGAIPLPPS